MRYLALVHILLIVFSLGCRQQADSNSPEPQDVRNYGDLPGLRSTTDKKLLDELNRIVEDGGTPEQLCKSGVSKSDNAAEELLVLFPDHRLDDLLGESEKLFPSGRFEFNPVELHRAINFRKRHDAARLRARAALERPWCDFDIDFTAGFQADLKFIAAVQICARLEAFHAAEAIEAGKADEAVESLAVMLHLAQCLGAERHVEARLEAALLRTEAFNVLQAVVLSKNITQKDLERLQEIVQKQLDDWPDDAEAWIGDRAIGMHSYELVRDGRLTELLTLRELDLFAKEGKLKKLLADARQNVDADELYYLQIMRRIIDSCGRPYYQRASLFNSIREDLQRRRNSPEFPLVAGRLLLPDIQKGHAIQAQDRANWDAWALALALATGRPLPTGQINPLTGENYMHSKQDDRIVVENFGSGEQGDRPSISVPSLFAP